MADSASQQGLIAQFVGITSVNEDRAKFYLESAAWNLDMALAGFFDHGEEAEVAGNSTFENLRRDPTPPRQAVQPPARQTAGKKSTASSRIATIGSLRPDESDSSGEEGQAYYAGGSEHGGGQQIIGPSKKKKGDADSIVSDVFRAAREHGAEVVDPREGASSHTHNMPSFQGRAYRLGDNDMESTVMETSSREPDRRQVDMVLKMWQNGFSVDDGPLRDFQDPTNHRFLQAIQKGEVPQELVHQARGGEVNLSMEDHRTEEYVKPAVVIQPFSGEGHRLGCPSDPVTVANDSARSMVAARPTASAAAAGGNVHESEAVANLNVNTSQPTTSLQIRLADGTKLIGKFNHTHRVLDVRRYIVTARPDYASATFVLMTTFPNAELTDESLTLADAKLLNAVIVQRMK